MILKRLFFFVASPTFLFFNLFFAINQPLFAQTTYDNNYIQIKASDKYNKSAAYQSRWGQHYRKEWNTPVTFKKAMLDTLAGGLIPYRLGGGRQSKSLFLRDKNNREYVLRSIDKTFGKSLPEIAQNTFIEDIVDDQVTIGHPYSAVTIPPLAAAVHINHSIPTIYYIPKQDALGKYNDSIGDELYLFEQRADEKWETAENFGNAADIVSTEKMLEKIQEDNDYSIDQLLFVRSRLFDMFIGDWGRHEDQWRWGVFKDDNKRVYEPIPRDRDQAYTKFDGSRLKFLIGLGGLKHLQTFDHQIKDVERYNFTARNLDFHLTNEVTKAQWVNIALEMQQQLTDAVIDDAMLQLPKEVYPISGPDIASKLKSRRNALPQIAEKYYRFIAKEVEITGSKDTELFEVRRLTDTTTDVAIYKIANDGDVKKKPFYQRTFVNSETHEIRIYGLDGKDEYKVSGIVNRAIPLRLIGGPAKDNFLDASEVKNGGRNVFIYDNKQNDFNTKNETRLKLSSDTAIHSFVYDNFQYDKKSIRPIAFYNNDDRIYVGLAFSQQKHKWPKTPYGSKQYLDVKYSISQKAFSSTYLGTYIHAIGKWNAKILANYDAIRWTNFFGFGNNTERKGNDLDFIRVRSKQFIFSPSLERNISNRHRITFSPFFQNIQLINDTGRYLAKTSLQSQPGFYKAQNFAGAGLEYLFQVLNDSVLPTKGFNLLLGAGYTNNFSRHSNFTNYRGELNLYLPITRVVGISSTAGGVTLNGDPEFYQYNKLGGRFNLRGYERDRFYGNTTFYNQNDLRFIWNVRSHRFNGKLGVFGLYDVGRVWLNGEKSNTWHTGYGGGIIISPFNRIALSVAYATSKDDHQFHLSLLKAL